MYVRNTTRLIRTRKTGGELPLLGIMPDFQSTRTCQLTHPEILKRHKTNITNSSRI